MAFTMTISSGKVQLCQVASIASPRLAYVLLADAMPSAIGSAPNAAQIRETKIAPMTSIPISSGDVPIF